MAYEQKPGSFTLFKNEKEKDSHPDYRGKGLDLDGNEIEVSAWIKESKTGKKFMSCSIKPPFKPAAKANKVADMSDDIPF
jgi:uncharacterized protein (DUF736 family)